MAGFLMGEFGCRGIGSLDTFDPFDTVWAVSPEIILESALVKTVEKGAAAV